MRSYFQNAYFEDVAEFGGRKALVNGIAGLICGANIDNLLAPERIKRYRDPERFLCVQYAMNLLDQAIWTYFRKSHPKWLVSCAPFFTSRCSMCHGGIHSPESLLLYAANPVTKEHVRLEIPASLLQEVEEFFIPAYIESLPRMRRLLDSELISGPAILQHILEDKDCNGFAARYARRSRSARG